MFEISSYGPREKLAQVFFSPSSAGGSAGGGSPDQAPQVNNMSRDLESLVVLVASQLHDLWRAPRLLPGGTYEPRIKEVNGQEFDIANLAYPQLPEKFQTENRLAAEGALTVVLDAQSAGRDLKSVDFVEEAAAIVHDQWLERNGSWAPPEQNVPYAQLAEEEKQKDRVILFAAIAAVTS